MGNLSNGRSPMGIASRNEPSLRIARAGDHDQDTIHELIRGLPPRDASRTLMFNIGCWNARLRIISKYNLVRSHGSVGACIDRGTDGDIYDQCRRLIMLGMRRLGRIHRTNDIPIADTGYWACIDECWRSEFFCSYEYRRRIHTDHLSFSDFIDHVQKLNHIVSREYSLISGRRGFATDDYGVDILARSWYLFRERKCVAFFERLARAELLNVYQAIFGKINDMKKAKQLVREFDSFAERYQERG